MTRTGAACRLCRLCTASCRLPRPACRPPAPDARGPRCSDGAVERLAPCAPVAPPAISPQCCEAARGACCLRAMGCIVPERWAPVRFCPARESPRRAALFLGLDWRALHWGGLDLPVYKDLPVCSDRSGDQGHAISGECSSHGLTDFTQGGAIVLCWTVQLRWLVLSVLFAPIPE